MALTAAVGFVLAVGGGEVVDFAEGIEVGVGDGVIFLVGVGLGVEVEVGDGVGVGVGVEVGDGVGVEVEVRVGVGVGLSLGICTCFVIEFTSVVAEAATACILLTTAIALYSENSNIVRERTPTIILLGVSVAQMALSERWILLERTFRLFFIFAFLDWLGSTNETPLHFLFKDMLICLIIILPTHFGAVSVRQTTLLEPVS